MHRQVDHDTDVRHARRERSDACDRDRKDVFAGNCMLDRGDRRVEPFDMTDHQSHAGLMGGGNDVSPLLYR